MIREHYSHKKANEKKKRKHKEADERLQARKQRSNTHSGLLNLIKGGRIAKKERKRLEK